MGERELKDSILTAIASMPDLSHENIGVEVFDGRIFLVGSVGTTAQETEALEAAQSVPGVKEVLSALRVFELEPEETSETDDTIKHKVEAALLDHGLVIHGGGVTVVRGEVYLQGWVEHERQRVQIERIATTIKDVKAVHNELQVRGQSMAAGG